jgi:hypothetical protein
MPGTSTFTAFALRKLGTLVSATSPSAARRAVTTPDRRVDPMGSPPHPAEMHERGDHADGPVAAHADDARRC